MNNAKQRDEYQRMIAIIKPELERLSDLIYLWGPADDDQEFADLIKKASYYRDILEKIESELNRLRNM